MPDKKVVSTSTATSTKTKVEADGTVVETITTTTTEKYSDGTTGTKTATEVKRKSAPSGTKSGASTAAKNKATLLVAQDPATCKAPKAENKTDPKFIQEALTRHNELREKHGSPPLILNDELGKIAQAWANKIAKDGKMSHNDSGFGENVYYCTEAIGGKRPVDQWYSEIKDFKFQSKMEGQKGTGHFTQVIWKSTKEMGIAMASGPKGNFVVANYNPPGNIINKYADNISKPN